MKKFIAIVITVAMLMAMSVAVAAEFVSSPPANPGFPSFPGFVVTPWGGENDLENSEEIKDAYEELDGADDISDIVEDIEEDLVVRDIYEITVEDDLKDTMFDDGPKQVTIDAGLKDEDFEVIFRVGDGAWEVLKDVILNEDGSITITIDREGVIAILVNSDDGSGNEPQPPQTSDPMFIILGVMVVAGVATVTVAKKRKA